MRHRPERHAGHAQADLFEPPAPRPRWADLPQDARMTVTELLAQLLVGERRPLPTRAEVEHE